MDFHVNELVCSLITDFAFKNVGASGTGHVICVSVDSVVTFEILIGFQRARLVYDVTRYLIRRGIELTNPLLK